METRIRYLGGVKFEAETRGHRLLCDQPHENGGADEAMTPPELMLASLGTCAAFYAVQYLKARSLPPEGVDIHVEAEKAMQPPRIGSFRITVGVPGVVEERHREGLMRAVRGCLIHNTLLNRPDIDVAIHLGADASLAA